MVTSTDENGRSRQECPSDAWIIYPKERMIRWIDDKLGRMGVMSYRHPLLFLLAVAALTSISFSGAWLLRLDTDLARLLPQSFESVQDLKILKERYGGEGYLVVVGHDAEPDALKRFADDIAPKLAALPEVRYVEKTRPTDFLHEHALYFLDLQDLDIVRDRLKKREEWELVHAHPFYVDLLNTRPPSVDFTDIERKYRERWFGADVFGELRSSYYLDEDRRLIAILVKPRGLASDLDFAQKLVDGVNATLTTIDLSVYGPRMKSQLTGRYKKRVDLQLQMRRDLRVASIAALLLMLAFVSYHFRRPEAIVLVFVPLLASLVWTFGFAWVAFGELNVLTAFIGTILLGLGIDHGIHLLSRYELENAIPNRAPDAAVHGTFSTTGRAVMVAALTTTVAFAGLTISEFKAFYQFGVIAAVGMILTVVAYLTCLPALLGLAARFGWRPISIDEPCGSSYGRFLGRKAPLVLALFVLLSMTAIAAIPRASFNYDFAALDDANLPSYRLDATVNEIVGHSQTPLVVLVPAGEDEKKYLAALHSRKEELGDKSSVSFILSLAELVPDQQSEKQPAIREIGRILERMDLDKVDVQRRRMIEDLIRMTKAASFREAELPEDLVRRFQGVKDSRNERVILLFPSIKLTQGDLVVNLARELRNISLPGGQVVHASGEAMIFADMLNMVFTEALPILATTVALVLLAKWILMGSFFRALMCIIPGAMTLLSSVGLSSFLDLQFNYINIVALPVLFGIGVDGGVYLVSHMEIRRDINYVVTRTGRAIGASILTTALGFGALVLAHHPGLRSLGELAVLGLGVNLLYCLVGVAAMTALVYPVHRNPGGTAENRRRFLDRIG